MQVTAVVPLKALGAAKQRLAPTMDASARRSLVAHMADRVLTACLEAASVRRVLAVAGDEAAAAVLRRSGVRVIVEPRRGLHVALDRAARELEGDPSLVIHADLPLVLAEDIDVVCAAAPAPPSVIVVPARDGGTAALLRTPHDVIGHAFGPGSAEAHLRMARDVGAQATRLEVPRLGLDVDDQGGLRRAAERDPTLGRWLTDGRTNPAPTTLHGDNHPADSGAEMPQGTVKHFDIETNTGTILLDNQDELTLDAETFAASGLLELRLGQRVRFDIEEDDEQRRIRRLTIVSL